LASAAALWPAAGCSSPARFDNHLTAVEAPLFPERRLTLIFEREGDFRPLAGREVRLTVLAPAKLVSPADGRGVTDAAGRLEARVEPTAVYDRSALKTGDVVVEFPVFMTALMAIDGAVYEWDIDDRESFARYQDPLYRGLNRDPGAEPLRLTLTLP
jgi:hypothetical protein